MFILSFCWRTSQCVDKLYEVDVLSLFTSNRRAQKVAYKYFQYMKDRDTNTDTGVKIYWRCENRKCKQFLFFPYESVFDQILTKFRQISDQLS